MDITAALTAASDPEVAHKRGQHLRPFRGLRGVPLARVAEIAAEAWKSGEEVDLHALFMQGHEDGLVAIGLLAATLPDDPSGALEQALEWIAHVDDFETADALGWMVLGPAQMALGQPPTVDGGPRPEGRRVCIAAGLARLPLPVFGPAAAPLRERLGMRELVFVEEPRPAEVQRILSAFVRDPNPQVQKALSRLLRELAAACPEEAQEWVASVKGGIPKPMRAELEKGLKLASR